VPQADELGFGRPCVLGGEGGWQMWYSRRSLSGAYDLGYASSADGVSWERHDELAGLELGPRGAWASEMVGLSCILELADRRLLFYNGNGYGATGFGVAVAEGI
jgi:hypothetical protein